MWSKALKIFMAAAAALMMVVVLPMGQAAAVGVDTVVKAVGGKAVVRAVSEKAGLMLSPKQLDNVVSVIEKKSFDGDQKSIDFLNKANAIDMIPVSSTPATTTGFKKYVLDPMLWLTGLDLVFEAVNAFKDGYDDSTAVPIYTKPGVYNNQSNYLRYTQSSNTVYFLYWSNAAGQIIFNGTTFTGSNLGSWTVKLESNGSVVASGVNTLSQTSFVTILALSTQESVVEVLPKQEDVIPVADVQTTKQYFDNDTYDSSTTYNLEVEMPDNYTTYNYDNDTTVWNVKDPELELEVAPPPPPVTTDPDNDDGKGDSIDVLVRVDDEIPIHEKFFLEMADMGQKVEDMYNGLVHFFDTAATGFQGLTDGMTGFTSFLDSFFDWLPDEYVTLLGSGFALGVVAFFIRR